MPIIKVALPLVLTLLIFGVLQHIIPSAEGRLDPIVGQVKEILSSENKELYVEKIVSSEIKDTENQKISIDLICKNLLRGAESCVDIFFFSLIDTSGEEYLPKLIGSKILAARIPARDIVHGTLTFVIPKAENATKLIYSENEGSDLEIDLSSTKDPPDKPPESEWKLVRNKGLKLADSNIELRIYDETRIDNYYVMDISIRNIGSGVVNYHALYAYLKSDSGFFFDAELYSDIEAKIESGTLQYGQQVRGKIAFDIENESGPFMLIYDDIAGSYFATGQLVPKISSEVTGKIKDTEDMVKINKHKAYWDPNSNTYKIIGEVSNESGQFVNAITINTVLRDKSEEIISRLNSTLTGYVETVPVTLSPNASLPFFLEFNIANTVANNVGSYELSVSYSFSKPKIAALEIKSAQLVQASKPTPLSKYVLWQIRGEMENTGDSRSTHTRITAALYDSNNSIVGVGGFSVLDQQPRDLNPGQSKLFSIEIASPKSFQPSSFYIYAESDQFVSIESKTETVVEIEPESMESLPVQSEKQTLIKIMSKQREDLLQFSVKNLPNSTSIYGIQMSLGETEVHILKSKLRWNSEETAQNEILLNTINNSIRAGQETRFLFSVGGDIDVITWKLLDLDGEVLLEGKVKPFQIRH
jgi:hypothetical protein